MTRSILVLALASACGRTDLSLPTSPAPAASGVFASCSADGDCPSSESCTSGWCQHPDAPTVVALTPPTPDASGCVTVTYSVWQREGLAIDVGVDYSVAGGSFVPATTTEPLTNLTSSAQATGEAHTFAWQSGTDVPGRDAAVVLRLTASQAGHTGRASTAALTVLNGLRFAGATQLTNADDPNIPFMPMGVAIGDFDQNGDNDLAVAGNWDATVAVLYGDGSGGFGRVDSYEAQWGPQNVVLADVDENGWLDMVAADWAQGRIHVYRNDGTGTFLAAEEYSSSNPVDVALGDVDENGHLDIVCGGEGNRIVFWYGDGSGTFANRYDEMFSDNLYSVGLGDMNEDGHLDVVVSDDWQTVTVVLGDGTGANWTRHELVFDGESPMDLVVTDLDGDTHADVVVGMHTGNSVAALFGDGSGTMFTRVDLAGVTSPSGVEVGDINGDRHLDVAAASDDDAALVVFAGLGNRSFAPPRSLSAAPYSTSGNPLESAKVTVGDLDGDGSLDVVGGFPGAENIAVVLSEPTPSCP